MQFNINLNDEQSDYFARLLRDDDDIQEPVTAAEMSQFFGKCIRSALSLDLDGVDNIGDAVVEDINRGGWSMVHD